MQPRGNLPSTRNGSSPHRSGALTPDRIGSRWLAGVPGRLDRDMRGARRTLFGGLAAATLLAALPAIALGADGSAIDTGDTAWMLMSTALVMVMLPGLALFYGGLVRRKNVLSTIMHSFFGLAMVSVVWVVVGFSLAFGSDVGGLGLIGNPFDFVGFISVGLEPNPTYGPTIPFILFAAFQLMFAAITPALITGAVAERKRFGAFVLFTVLWSVLVYSPVAHWVWSVDGWLFKLGALDFAGGTVVHATSGVSALLVALLIGRRAVNGDGMEPHDIPMTVLGAGLLWFGWFGFNAGSSLGANGLAANALLVTNTAAAAATITWVLASYLHKKKVSVVGAAAGAVAGLVAITPASGFVTAGGALAIGLVAGGLCYSATLLRERIHIDDALDVFAVHGVGGMFGAIITGVFATTAINSLGRGAIDGNPGQVLVQVAAVAATVAYAVGTTFVIVKVVDFVLGMRVPALQEEMGLDLAVHGEAAYQV
jgi:Amt family ammonium transporter